MIQRVTFSTGHGHIIYLQVLRCYTGNTCESTLSNQVTSNLKGQAYAVFEKEIIRSTGRHVLHIALSELRIYMMEHQ